MRHVAATIGRLLFGGYFVYNGINHFRNREMMSHYAGSKDVPSPETAVLGSGALLLAGGLSVISGVKPRAGLVLLATFLLGVTPVMHAFWSEEDAQQKANQQVHLLKNTALLGSVLMLMGSYPWARERPVRRTSGYRYMPGARDSRPSETRR
jgi:uncharacterized membrane protein YphA (DoxX/SURF4 family)